LNLAKEGLLSCIKVFKKSFDRCQSEIMLKLDKEERDKYGSSSTSGKEKSQEASINSKVEES
jgi:hypothetical protein